jgi:hypothetical protein
MRSSTRRAVSIPRAATRRASDRAQSDGRTALANRRTADGADALEAGGSGRRAQSLAAQLRDLAPQRIDVDQVRGAHEDFGGELPEHLQAKADAWFEKADPKRRELFAHPAAPTARAKVGRNDPRPCASGRRFKKCCIGKEAS